MWDGVLPYRHVAFNSNRRGMQESENGSDSEASPTGVQCPTEPRRYMGGVLTKAGLFLCSNSFGSSESEYEDYSTTATNDLSTVLSSTKIP